MPACTITCPTPSGEHGEGAGAIAVPVAGTVVIAIASPRPLRLWLGDRLVLDEDLWWRRYERLLRAIVVVPLAAGSHSLRAAWGPRPLWPPGLDRECPSRNREAVRSGLRERRPDRLDLVAEVQPGADAVAASLRVLPGQCVEGGVTWQHVLARRLDAPRPGQPCTECDRPGGLPLPALALRSAVAPFHARDASDETDRAAGLARFLVPVANAVAPLPAARAADAAETRLEPECAVVTRIRLEITAALAAPPPGWRNSPAAAAAPVAAELPVHEARGRLAPRREHRELRWPSEDELLAGVPRPLLPPACAGFARLHDHAWRMLRHLRRAVDPRSGLPNDYIGTARESFLNEMFVWDSSFTAMCTAWGWRALPHTATLDCLYSRQMDGGYLHREHDVREGIAIGYEPDFSPNPPISAVAEWKIAALTGDTARLAQVHPILAAQHGWLRRNGYPDLTAQQAHAAEILGLIAAATGCADPAPWAAERQAIAAAMNARLWSPELRFFSTSLPGGGHNPNKVVTGFWPLWTGLVPAERVADCARHLLDPGSFWRHHPIPSLAADSPAYVPGGNYWLGSTWAPTNAAAAWGFARSGRHDLARRLVRRHLEVLLEVHAATGVLWENYGAERSERGSWSGPDYSWTALGPIALLYEVLIGIEPDALHDRIRWTLPEEPGWGLERIPLGPATIDLRLAAPGRIAVACDRAFTLEVTDAGVVRAIRLAPGRHELAVAELAPLPAATAAAAG